MNLIDFKIKGTGGNKTVITQGDQASVNGRDIIGHKGDFRFVKVDLVGQLRDILFCDVWRIGNDDIE